ncbi:hypothetical protein [Microbacterium pumilum]|uniref:DNA repair exonuclease n=1 Tax=Microbacterium pumilum TaxID=344165 RepID=A0ABN2SXV7_9MICO
MPSIIAFSGINIDRAYPGLGPDAAARRRALSLSALVKVTQQVRDRSIDAIVIVGGLYDDRSVGRETLAAALQVLESAGVPVLIAPGRADPIVAGGEYETGRLANNVWAWTSTEFAEGAQVGGIGIVGRARRGVWDSTPQLSPAFTSAPYLVVGDGIEYDRFEPPAVIHVVTTGSAETADSRSTVLRPVNGDLGEPFGRAAVILIDHAHQVAVDWVDLLAGHPSTEDVDVTSAATTADLLAQVIAAAKSLAPWSVLHLRGLLQPGVVIPATKEEMSGRDDILITDEALEFASVTPESDDHSALAEFARSLDAASVDDRTRHQAMAFGLLALQSSVSEGASL